MDTSRESSHQADPHHGDPQRLSVWFNSVPDMLLVQQFDQSTRFCFVPAQNKRDADLALVDWRHATVVDTLSLPTFTDLPTVIVVEQGGDPFSILESSPTMDCSRVDFVSEGEFGSLFLDADTEVAAHPQDADNATTSAKQQRDHFGNRDAAFQ